MKSPKNNNFGTSPASNPFSSLLDKSSASTASTVDSLEKYRLIPVQKLDTAPSEDSISCDHSSPSALTPNSNGSFGLNGYLEARRFAPSFLSDDEHASHTSSVVANDGNASMHSKKDDNKSQNGENIFGLSLLKSMSDALPSICTSPTSNKFTSPISNKFASPSSSKFTSPTSPTSNKLTLYQNNDDNSEVVAMKKFLSGNISTDSSMSSPSNHSKTSEMSPISKLRNDLKNNQPEIKKMKMFPWGDLSGDSLLSSPSHDTHTTEISEESTQPKNFDQSNFRVEEAKSKIKAASASLKKPPRAEEDKLETEAEIKTEDGNGNSNGVNQTTSSKKSLKGKHESDDSTTVEMHSNHNSPDSEQSISVSNHSTSLQKKTLLGNFETDQEVQSKNTSPNSQNKQQHQQQQQQQQMRTSPISLKGIELCKTFSTVTTLTNELVELRQLREQDKILIEKREGQVQNLSCLLSNEKEISRKRKEEATNLEKKILGLEQVIVADQHNVNEAFVKHKISEIEKERDEFKTRLEELQRKHDEEKDNNIRLAGQMETYETQSRSYMDLITTQENKMKIATDSLDRTERLLKASIQDNERFGKQMQSLEVMIKSTAKDLNQVCEEKKQIERELDEAKNANLSGNKEKKILEEGLVTLLERMREQGDVLPQSPSKTNFESAIQTIAIMNERLSSLQNAKRDLTAYEACIKGQEDQLSKAKESCNEMVKASQQLEGRIKSLEEEILEEKEYSKHGYDQIKCLEKDLDSMKQNEKENLKKLEEDKLELLKLMGKIDVLESQAKSHANALQSARTETKMIREENDLLKKFESRNLDLQHVIEKLKEDLSNQQLECSQLKERLSSTNESNDILKNEKQELNEKMKILEDSIKSENKDLKQLTEMLNDTELKRNELQKDIQQNKEEFLKEKGALLQEINDLFLNLENTRKDLSSIGNELEEAQSTNRTTIAEKEKLQSDYEAITIEKNRLEGEHKSRGDDINQLRKQIEDLQTQLSNEKMAKEGLNEHVSTLEACVEEEKDHSKVLISQISSLDNEHNSYIQRISKLECLLQDETHKTITLEGKIETLTFEAHEHLQEIEETRAKLTKLQRELELMQNHSFSALNEEEKVAHDLKINREHEISALQNEVEALKKQLSSLGEYCASLHREKDILLKTCGEKDMMETESTELVDDESKLSIERLQDEKDTLEERKLINPFGKLVSGDFLLLESKTAQMVNDLTSKQNDLEIVATQLATCERGIQTIDKEDQNVVERMTRELSLSIEKINEMLMEMAAMEASLEECESEKQRLCDELKVVQSELDENENERGEMVDVITELIEELDCIESEHEANTRVLKRKGLLVDVNRKEDSSSQNSNPNEYQESLEKDDGKDLLKDTLDKLDRKDRIIEEERKKNDDMLKEHSTQIEKLREMYENVRMEKMNLQAKLNSVESKVKKWRQEFTVVKHAFLSNYSTDEAYSFDGLNDLSAILHNESLEEKTLEEYQDDLVDSYKQLAQKYRRSQEKISVLEDALVDIKSRSIRSGEENAGIKNTDHTTESNARRAEQAEEQLAEVLDLLEESNNELTDAVRIKCSLEYQLHEALHAMKEFEFGTRLEPDEHLPDSNIGAEMFRESINLAKCLTDYLHKNLQPSESDNREHVTDAWRNLGKMSKLISHHENLSINDTIPDRHDTIPDRPLDCNSSLTSSLSNESRKHKMFFHLKTDIDHKRPSEIDVYPSSKIRNKGDRGFDEQIAFLKTPIISEEFIDETKVENNSQKTGDEYFSNFHALIENGEHNLQNALKDVLTSARAPVHKGEQFSLNGTIDSRKFEFMSNIFNETEGKHSLRYFIDRCETVENERDLILLEALDLVESSKKAREAEAKAAEANFRTTMARELAECREHSKEQLSSVTQFMCNRYSKLRLFYTWKLRTEQKKHKKINTFCEVCRGSLN